MYTSQQNNIGIDGQKERRSETGFATKGALCTRSVLLHSIGSTSILKNS